MVNIITISFMIHDNNAAQIEICSTSSHKHIQSFPIVYSIKYLNEPLSFQMVTTFIYPTPSQNSDFRTSLPLCPQEMFRINPSQKGDECSTKHQLRSSDGENGCNSTEVSGALLPKTDSKPLGIFSLTSLGFGAAKDLILQERIDKINKVGRNVGGWEMWEGSLAMGAVVKYMSAELVPVQKVRKEHKKV